MTDLEDDMIGALRELVAFHQAGMRTEFERALAEAAELITEYEAWLRENEPEEFDDAKD